jgi:hypothetical protein
MSMTPQQFINIATAVANFPHRGWQKKLAHVSGVSQPSISLAYNGGDMRPISSKMAQKFLAVADLVANGDLSQASENGVSRAVEANRPVMDPDDELSDEEIISDISDRFTIFDECVRAVVCGGRHSTLISGPPGCGKSHTVSIHKDSAIGKFKPITGGISAIGLYKALYACKDDGVVVFDDCDEVFSDETKLNLLKGALDTKDERIISWMKESRSLVDEEGEDIPKSFDFQGRVLFLTNQDFDREVERGGKMSVHYAALMSRSGYLSLGLHSKRRRMLRIVQICQEADLVGSQGITDESVKEEILTFVKDNKDRFRELSLRLIVQLAEYYRDIPGRWKEHAEALQMRTKR